MANTLTSNDIGQQFVLDGIDGITYTLVWFRDVAEYIDGKPVLWAKVRRLGDGETYIVRQDSLRRIPCIICETRPVAIVVNALGAGYCSRECERSYIETE